MGPCNMIAPPERNPVHGPGYGWSTWPAPGPPTWNLQLNTARPYDQTLVDSIH